MNGIQTEELQILLRLVSIDRISNDSEWITILSMLAINNKLYSDLLYCITNRSFTRDLPASMDIFPSDVEHLNKTEYYQLSSLSIEYWANIDNPSRYRKLKYDTNITQLRHDIYDNIMLGDLQQFHFAKYLKTRFKYKFVTDYANKSCIWYELAINDDNTVVNSSFNWVKSEDKYPSVLLNYLTNDMTIMLKEIQAGLDQRLSDETDKIIINMLTPIKANIKKTMKRLTNKVFCQQVLAEFGFMVKRN